jgi:hypothetical protein
MVSQSNCANYNQSLKGKGKIERLKIKRKKERNADKKFFPMRLCWGQGGEAQRRQWRASGVTVTKLILV